VSIEDPFKPLIERVIRTEVHDGHKKAGHDIAFKPAKVVRDKPYTAAYEHLNDNVEVKKSFRDAEGAVVTAPKNFYTTPAKLGKVGKRTFFNGQPEHMADDYLYPQK
jgi:hypothetical protein